MSEGAGRPSEALPRIPELPVDPRFPGEPTVLEVSKTWAWLAKHDVQVSLPTRLLAIRIGARDSSQAPNAMGLRAIAGFLGFLGSLAYLCLQYLPNVRGDEMTESKIVYFVLGAMQLATWISVRRLDKLVHWARRPATSSRLKLLDGWYLTSTIITFVGGAALAVTMYRTTPALTYAWSWLGLLCLSAICFAVILIDILRRPVLAEDAASLAVDDMLRIEDAYRLATPAIFAVPVLFDLITTNRQPPEFTWWLVAYAVLAVGTQGIGWALYRRRHRALPPGYYGAPAAPVMTPPPFDSAPKSG